MLNIFGGALLLIVAVTLAVVFITRKVSMIQEPIQKKTRLILGVMSFLILASSYTLLANYSYYSHKTRLEQLRVEKPDQITEEMARSESRVIPTWSQLLEGLKMMFASEEKNTDLLASVMNDTKDLKSCGERMIVRDIKATGMRFFVGYLISTVVGVYVGLMMGSNPSLEAFTILPLKLMSRIIPTAALAVFFALVGTDLEMYVCMIIFGTIPAIAISTCLEVKSFHEELKQKAYTLGASHFEVIFNALFKVKLPQIIEVVKNNIGPAIVYLIAAELFVAGSGFGYTIRIFSRKLDMSVVYPYLLILAGIGFLFDLSLTYLQQVLCPWYKKRK